MAFVLVFFFVNTCNFYHVTVILLCLSKFNYHHKENIQAELHILRERIHILYIKYNILPSYLSL